MLRRAEVYGITFEELCQGLEVEAVLLHGPGHLLPPAAGAGQHQQVPGPVTGTHLMSRSRMLSTLLAATLAIFLNLILCSYIRFVVDNV